MLFDWNATKAQRNERKHGVSFRSVHGPRPKMNAHSMSTQQNTEQEQDMREEYDFADMPGGVQGKYADAFDKDTVAVVLDADVAEVFPNAKSVNEALRTLARLYREEHRRSG